MKAKSSSDPRLVGCAWLVLFSQWPGTGLTSDIVSLRIHHVENGLILPVVLKGQTPTRMDLQNRMAFYKTPAVSIAVINDGQIEWVRAYGVRRAGSHDSITTETLFQAGSISKPVSAAAALALIEQRGIAIDDDVNASLTSWDIPDNEFTSEQSVTWRHILTHTGGLTNHAVGTYAAGDSLPTLLQILNGLGPSRSQPIRVDYVPGSRWRYSGGGYTVLQQALIDISHKTFPELLSGSVLQPLHMSHSTFEQPISDALAPFAAVGHNAAGELLTGNWRVFPEMAAAGLWSTPSDLAQFLIEIRSAAAGGSTRILTVSTARAMVSPQFDNWGLGFAVAGKDQTARFHHGGDTEGYKCEMVAYRNVGRGAVIMTNSERGDRLIAEVLRSVAHEYGWLDYQPKEKQIRTLDPSGLEAIVGRYTLEINTDVSVIITQEASRVMMELVQPGSTSKVELLPESDSIFFRLEVDQEIVFGKNGAGRVTHLLMRQGDEEYRANRITEDSE